MEVGRCRHPGCEMCVEIRSFSEDVYRLPLDW